MLQLDDWVLCRIYNKKGTVEKYYNNVDQNDVVLPEVEDQKPNITQLSQNGAMLTPAGIPPAVQTQHDYVHFDTSESVPKWHTDSSCCSEQVLSSPEFAADKEVQSAPKWEDLDFQLNNFMETLQDDPFQVQQYNDPFQDMFMYMQKPF